MSALRTGQRVRHRVTGRDLLDALHRRHGQHAAGSRAWVCIEEALSGWANFGTGGIDLMAFGVWRTAKVPGLPRCGQWNGPAEYAVVAYEVKASRADFRRELAVWPDKAQVALDVAHYFLFVTPPGLLDEHERTVREPWPHGAPRLWLPEGSGLIEVNGNGCRVVVPAALREPRALTRGEQHELLRRAWSRPVADLIPVEPVPGEGERGAG